jgi:hypothetical protein
MGRPLLDKLAGSANGHNWAQIGKAENGPVADSRLLAKVPAKAVGLLSTQWRPYNSNI